MLITNYIRTFIFLNSLLALSQPKPRGVQYRKPEFLYKRHCNTGTTSNNTYQNLYSIMPQELLTENVMCQGQNTSTIFYLVFPELLGLSEGKKIKIIKTVLTCSV